MQWLVLWSTSCTKTVSINDSCDYPFQKFLWDEENYTVQGNATFLEATNTHGMFMELRHNSSSKALCDIGWGQHCNYIVLHLLPCPFWFPHIHSFTGVALLQEHWMESPFFSVFPREFCLLWFANRMQTMEKDMNQKFSLNKRTGELLSIQDGGNGGWRANMLC